MGNQASYSTSANSNDEEIPTGLTQGQRNEESSNVPLNVPDDGIAVARLEQEETLRSHADSEEGPPGNSANHTSSGRLYKIEQQIVDLIESREEKEMLMSTLTQNFESTYSTRLSYKELGFSKMKDMIAEIPSICIIPSAHPGVEYIRLFNINGIPPHLPEVSTQATQLELDGDTLMDSAVANESNHLLEVSAKDSVDSPSTLLDASKDAPDGTNPYICRPLSGSGDSDCVDPILRTAKSIIGCNLHKKILKLLDEHPNGVSCSQIIKDVKGFVYYLNDCARREGTEGFSPAAVLRHCQGIKEEKIDGKCMFFLDTECLGGLEQPNTCTGNHLAGDLDPLAESAVRNTASGALTIDDIAVEDFICLLHRKFKGSPWPASKKQLKPYLRTSDAPELTSWIERRFSDEISLGKRRKEALKLLIGHLQRSKCLRGTNNKLTWSMSCVSQIIERSKQTIGRDEFNHIDTGTAPEHDANTVRHDNIQIKLIETAQQLNLVRSIAPFAQREGVEEPQVVAIDCEGVPENIHLIQVGTHTVTYVFDCVKLGAREVCDALSTLLMDPEVTKLFHDLHQDAVAIARVGGVTPIHGTLDTQLAIELLSGDLRIGFNQMLQQLGRDKHPLKQRFKQQMDNSDLFVQRPLPPDVLEYAALDASLLLDAKDSLYSALGTMIDSVKRASDVRAKTASITGGARNLCFDVANSYSLASHELLNELRPADVLVPAPLRVSDDSDVLLEMLPQDLREALEEKTPLLSDIVLDKGRAPLAWVGGTRLLLGKGNRLINAEDIASIVEKLGGFGSDNRAGLEKQLHRISAIRNRQSNIIGLTMRIGRHVTGNATIISDLLFNDCAKSILFLGEPGSGKTTVVREATRLLSERFNVCIVDTSNEIAGDGDVPHPCVGFARRMMVPSLDKQSAVMIECVQNHTPEVMIIDEIGRSTEVEAARTCKQRGVRLIASAHGDLRKLVKNPKLRGLIGGVETVTLGDAQAKIESKKLGSSGLQKLKAQRAGSPVFDVIVELRKGAHHEWRIVLDTANAVDKILEGRHYFAERRTRDPIEGALTLELESA